MNICLLQLREDGEIDLVEFIKKEVPPYAILSHTWSPTDEEVSFADFTKRVQMSKTGWANICECGDQTARDGLKHF